MPDSVGFIQIKVNDANVSGTVQSVNVEDHDRLIDRARIVIDDPLEYRNHALFEQQVVRVDIGWSTEHSIVFEGVITNATTQSSGGAQQRVTLTALDFSHRVNQGENPQPLRHEGRLSAILRTIITRRSYGIGVGEIAPDPDTEYPATAPLLQSAGVKDWDFIQRLAIDNGCRAFVEFDTVANQSKFYFIPNRRLLNGDSIGTFRYCRGLSSLIDFRYQRIAGGGAPVQSAATPDPRTGDTALSQSAPPDPSQPAQPSAEMRTRLNNISSGTAMVYDQAIEGAAGASGQPSEQLPQTFLAGLPSDPALAERIVQRDPTRVIGLFGEGLAVGTARMRAKSKVSIIGLAPWAEGDWYVTRCNHLYTRVMAERQDRSTYRVRFAVTR